MQDDKIKITEKLTIFIKQKRLSLGMTQKEFAKFALDDEKYHDWISKIERGRSITLTTLERIFKNLDCDLEITE